MGRLDDMEIEQLIRIERDQNPEGDRPDGPYLVGDQKDAQALFEKGTSPKKIFLDLSSLTDEEIEKAAGKAYGLITSPEDAVRLDEAMDGRVSPGRLEPVGLILDGKDLSNQEEQVSTLARAVRRSRNLTIRSLFLDLSGQDLEPSVLSEAFSRIKKIRSDIPCQLECFCFLGVASADPEDDAIKFELERIANLNATSLYARFIIGE